MKTIRSHFHLYLRGIPLLLRYQFFSKILLAAGMALFNALAGLLLKGSGRVAVTSADFLFLFTTWQGALLLVIGLAVLVVYVMLDIVAQILGCAHILRGERISVPSLLKETLWKTRRFLNPCGLLVVLYVTLVVPIVGLGFSTTLTEGLQIPNFVMEVIYATPLYRAAFFLTAAGLLVLSLLGIFLFHFVLLDGRGVAPSLRASIRLVRAHWKKFLPRYLLLFFSIAAVLVLACFTAVIPGASAALWPMENETLQLFLTIFLSASGALLIAFLLMLCTPLQLLELTRFYLLYTGEPLRELPTARARLWIARRLLALVALAALFGALLTPVADELYGEAQPPAVVAHRGGGVLAAENTVAGIEAAAAAGANASEIDVQRTKDGFYIINHDDTFRRLCGVAKKPQEMTLDEIRALSVAGSAQGDDSPQPVATLEEALDAAAGRVTLFIELKGETADRRMADDVAALVRKKGMQDEVVLISLKYPLIQYISEQYGDLSAGLLYFASYGDAPQLSCDYLLLEEEAATYRAVSAIHDAGKKAIVWTVNTDDSLNAFLRSEADAIITDQVGAAIRLRDEIAQETTAQRLLEIIFN